MDASPLAAHVALALGAPAVAFGGLAGGERAPLLSEIAAIEAVVAARGPGLPPGTRAGPYPQRWVPRPLPAVCGECPAHRDGPSLESPLAAQHAE